MITIGVDYHKRTSTYHVLRKDGTILDRRKFINDPNLIEKYLTRFNEPIQLAMEATRSWDLFYQCVNKHVDYFYLGHPKKMKLITQQERKNDKQDARYIAELTHKNYLPKAYVSSDDERSLRALVRARGAFINKRRSIKNQIHALIDRCIWLCHRPQSFKNIFCKRGLLWLKNLELPEAEREVLNHYLAHLSEIEQKIELLEKSLKKSSVTLQGAKELRTVPGFKSGGINMYTVLVETGDIERFHKSKGFTFYAGLIPREFSSGDKYRTGRLVKNANMHLRTALIEATLAAIRVDAGLKAYYQSVKQRKNSGAAIIATARKLACAVYHVLKHKRPYIVENEINAPAVACHPSSTSLKK